MTILRFLSRVFPLLAAIALPAVVSQESPTISYISQQQTVDFGQQARLQCTVRNVGDRLVLWKKLNPNGNGQDVTLTTGPHMTINDSRFSLRFDEIRLTYSLQIEKVRKSDAGTYQCLVLNTTSNRVEARVSLSVTPPVSEGQLVSQESPTIAFVSEDQIVNIGRRAKLHCIVENIGDHPVLWMKVNPNGNGQEVPLTTGADMVIHDSRFSLTVNESLTTYTLQIEDVKESDAGTYQCLLLITISNRVTAPVRLSVRGPQDISNSITDPEVIVN